MTYALCLLYLAVIYIRPGEIVPGWVGFPFLEVVAAAATLSAIVSLLLRPRSFANLPNDWCFLGFFLAAVLSSPSNGWFGGGYEALKTLQPLLWFYLLVRLAVGTRRQLEWLIRVVLILTLFQAANGIVQYHTGTGLGGATAHLRLQAGTDTEDADIDEVKRIRGTGIFGDPNDLAMSLVIVLPFLFSAVSVPGSGLLRRIGAATAFGIIAYALILTQSRGGFVGVAAVCAAYAYRRFGRFTAVVAAVAVVVLLLATGPSRFKQLEASEESAQGRIQSWSAGLQMLKSKPVLGVGFGQFGDYNPLVAHNSFVHSLAELGFVGGYFFVGMFYWFFVTNGPGRDVAGAAQSRMAHDVWASGLGVMVCAIFLSRQYSPVLYVPLVIGAARVAIARQTDPSTPVQRGLDWVVLFFATCGVVIATYVAVRVLAVWSGG